MCLKYRIYANFQNLTIWNYCCKSKCQDVYSFINLRLTSCKKRSCMRMNAYLLVILLLVPTQGFRTVLTWSAHLALSQRESNEKQSVIYRQKGIILQKFIAKYAIKQKNHHAVSGVILFVTMPEAVCFNPPATFKTQMGCM